MNFDEMVGSKRVTNRRQGMTKSRITALAILGIALMVGIPTCGGLIETVDAGEIVVKQSALSGELTFWKDPGPKFQWWGKVTHYKKSSQYWFSSKNDQGNAADQSIKLRFNDGGHGNLSGSVRYDLPMDDAHLKMLHEKYGSQEAIDQMLIRTVMEKSVYFSGPLMSSTQSYAERRNELIGFIEDQASRGIYKSSSHCEKQPDAVTKLEKTVCVVDLERKGGNPVRVEPSPLEAYGIMLSNLSINDLSYDKAVNGQIEAQQRAFAEVQTAAAEARKAEQRAITVAKEGEANAAKAKWDQEVHKATAVTAAQQELEVAELARKTAEAKKAEQILLGEGEAARKRLVMSADGALAQKLEAWVTVNKNYADAFKEQPLVPQVVMGASSGGANSASAMSQLVDVLAVKTARDLGLDLAPRKSPK